jgi:hypothetical protein
MDPVTAQGVESPRASPADEPPEPPPSPAALAAPREWNYLATPAFQTRYVLAAHHMAGCADVVEIGGYRTPITNFLAGPHRSVLVLDPRIAPLELPELRGQPCRVRHLPRLFQEHDDYPADYGLVLLGIDLELYTMRRRVREETLHRFRRLLEGARRIVMEAPRDWPASRWLDDWILKLPRFRVHLRVRLEVLPEHLQFEASTSWPPICRRTFTVLDRLD